MVLGPTITGRPPRSVAGESLGSPSGPARALASCLATVSLLSGLGVALFGGDARSLVLLVLGLVGGVAATIALAPPPARPAPVPAAPWGPPPARRPPEPRSPDQPLKVSNGVRFGAGMTAYAAGPRRAAPPGGPTASPASATGPARPPDWPGATAAERAEGVRGWEGTPAPAPPVASRPAERDPGPAPVAMVPPAAPTPAPAMRAADLRPLAVPPAPAPAPDSDAEAPGPPRSPAAAPSPLPGTRRLEDLAERQRIGLTALRRDIRGAIERLEAEEPPPAARRRARRSPD